MSEVIASADFQSRVLDSSKPVLVDFFATWCGPCKTLAPVLDEVAAELKDTVDVVKVDIDQSPDLATRYGVMSVPTLAIFEKGELLRQVVGVQPKQAILQLIGQ